jgi:hypothetical protein
VAHKATPAPWNETASNRSGVIVFNRSPIPTPQEVKLSKTASGIYTRKQLTVWGVPWPPQKGWQKVLREQYLANVRKRESAVPWPSKPLIHDLHQPS